MISTSFSYAAPDTLAAALGLLGQAGHQVLPADHSLVSRLRQGGAAGQTLVSLRQVPGLATITEENGQLAIGSSVSYAELIQHESIADYPVLAQALATIQDPHLRHHSTLSGAVHGGGRVHAPVLAALLALDAQAVLHSAAGFQEVPLLQLTQVSGAAAGTLVTQILLPAGPVAASHYLTAGPARSHYSSQGVAVAQHGDQIRVVLAGFAEQVVRVAAVETALRGQPLTTATIAAAAYQLDNEPALAAAGAADAGYHQHLAKVLVRRALAGLLPG